MRREILFFIPDFNGGGAERALINLLTYWPGELGSEWCPVVVVRQHAGALCDKVPPNIEVISLQLPRSGLLASATSVARLGSVLRKRRPCLIVTFLSLPSVVLARALALQKSVLVSSVQSPFALNGMSSSWKLRVLAWASRKTDYFWTISPGLAREVGDVFDIAGERLKVLPNSVDLAQIRSNQDMPVDHPAFQSADTPVIITAGRLALEKRVDLLVEAASYLAPQMQFNLVILGEGAQLAQLKQLASNLGIGARTFFPGFQPNPWKFISKSTVFALASDVEGFGNVLVEAMACGVPVVTTRAPIGPEYIVSSSDCGLLVPTGDPNALAEGLRRMLSDRELRQHCVEGGFKRAADFDVGQISQTFAELVLQCKLPVMLDHAPTAGRQV